MLGGFNLWPDLLTGVKTVDCAVVYTVIINIYYIATKQWELPRYKFIYVYLLLLVFLLASAIFSFIHYGLSPIQIFQGGRSFILLLSLPILWKCEKSEFNKTLRLLLYATILNCVLFVPQVFLGINLMPYGEASVDGSTGLYRYYNFPILLELFLCLSFFYRHSLFGIKSLYLNTVLLLTLLCTLGRSMIILTILCLIVFMFVTGAYKRYIKQIPLFFIVLCATAAFVSTRFMEGGTEDDIKTIMEGGFDQDYNAKEDATMTYRLAWCYERGLYLLERPIGEQVFGLGMVSDSQEWVYNNYNFLIGLEDEEHGVYQLSTPDIAYGNLITKYGFGGSVICLLFLICLCVFFIRNRKRNIYFKYYAVSLPLVFLLGLSGSTFSEPQYFCMPFFMMSLMNRTNRQFQLKQLLLLFEKKQLILK